MGRIKALLCALTMVVVPVALAEPAHAGTTFVKAKVYRWIDGDTVATSRGRVRLIGLDTPEYGRCGYTRAGNLARAIAPAGSWVTLGNPSSVRDKDRYGRLLRYVNRGTVDVARRQIRAGARARYDGVDGYQWHPRQRAYRTLDRSYANYGCTAAELASYAPTSAYHCPSNAPIKGNQGSSEWIYHLPWQRYYDATNPEQCFATEIAAQRAGYRRAKV